MKRSRRYLRIHELQEMEHYKVRRNRNYRQLTYILLSNKDLASTVNVGAHMTLNLVSEHFYYMQGFVT